MLTASDLNSEFNNIITNASSLITPLTTNLAFGGFSLTGLGAGSSSSPSLSFTSDTNTGLYSSAADSIDLVGGGVRVVHASGYADGVNFLRVVPSKTTQAVEVQAAGTDTNVGLKLVAKGTGYVEATSFRFGVFTATQTADFDGRAYWHKDERTLHVVGGGAINRVPSVAALQTGDLIIATGTVSGATTFSRLGIGTNGQALAVDGGVPVWTASASVRWAQFSNNGTSSPTIQRSSGVSYVAREAAGEYRVDWTTPFSSTAYAAMVIGGGASEVYAKLSQGTPYQTTGVFLSFRNQNGTPDDSSNGMYTVTAHS